MRKSLFALVSLLLLAACDTTGSLKELRTAALPQDSYAAALAKGYKDFAEEKVADYDWWTSKYFADKGLMAAYGRDIQPEEPANWEIPKTRLSEFTISRNALLRAVDAGQGAQPQLAASAVVAYDRWLESEQKGWDLAKIEGRRDDFFSALQELQEAQAEGAYAAAPHERPVESTSTVLYFPFDSDKLAPSAQAALAQLVHDVLAAGNVSVSINGHADRAGTDQHNLSLSERRARYVQKMLEQAGVPAKLMHYFAFGESDPAIPTEDGVREVRNRRVEIFIE